MTDGVPRRRDAALRRVLRIKIGFTAAVWAAPLLLLPPDGFAALGFPSPEPMIFPRLLGAAFVALLVGYVRGLRALQAGRPPADAIAVGVVSNGLASALLVAYGAAGAYGQWKPFAAAFMWSSAAATALITLALLAVRPR